MYASVRDLSLAGRRESNRQSIATRRDIDWRRVLPARFNAPPSSPVARRHVVTTADMHLSPFEPPLDPLMADARARGRRQSAEARARAIILWTLGAHLP